MAILTGEFRVPWTHEVLASELFNAGTTTDISITDEQSSGVSFVLGEMRGEFEEVLPGQYCLQAESLSDTAAYKSGRSLSHRMSRLGITHDLKILGPDGNIVCNFRH